MTQAQVHPTYSKQADYQRALVVGEADGNQDGADDTFTPPAMRFMTRAAWAVVSGGNKARFNFADSRPLWPQLRPGDYVRYPKQEQFPLFGIESVGRDGAALVPVLESPPDTSQSLHLPQSLPSGKAFLIRTIRPIEYCLSMVGIYIHHLFFAVMSGESGDAGALPSVVWMIEQGKCSGFIRSRVVG